jgi:large subunit ribosomal protein L37Ae
MAGREMPKSVRRFGSRYGRRTRMMFGLIEKDQRSLHKCPYCNDVKAKRISVGIWQCKKCSAKFTGKAYKL